MSTDGITDGMKIMGETLVAVLNEVIEHHYDEMQREGRMLALTPQDARDQAIQASSIVFGTVILALCETTGQDFDSLMERAKRHIVAERTVIQA